MAPAGIPLIVVNESPDWLVPGFCTSMMVPSAPSVKIRSPFGASLSESGSLCGTTSSCRLPY